MEVETEGRLSTWIKALTIDEGLRLPLDRKLEIPVDEELELLSGRCFILGDDILNMKF